jgi:hypothetical protein
MRWALAALARIFATLLLSCGGFPMTSYRRVDARDAGPQALGILVPPGRRTVVILRPRSLPWDLLALEPGLEERQPAVFAGWERNQAAIIARRTQESLTKNAGSQPGPLEVVRCAAEAFGVCARLEGFLWIACLRAPGQPYQPALFATRQEAEGALAQLSAYLWPPAGVCREYYFNTQAFSRSV